MDSETDLDDTVGDSEEEDMLLQQTSRRQSKSRSCFTLIAENLSISPENILIHRLEKFRSGHSLYTDPSGSNVSTVSSIEERDESEA